MDTILSILLAPLFFIGGFFGVTPPQEQNLGLAVLTVPQGGTGNATFPVGECLVGNGTGALTTDTCGSGSSGTVSTSTNETAGGLPYWTSTSGTPALLGQVATGTLSASSPLSVTAGRSVIGGSAALSLDTSGTWSGNAGTASALAADPTDCSAGSFPLGINAAGTAQNCTDAWTEAENTAAGYTSNTGTVTSVATTWPLTGGTITTTGTLVWGGLATTSNPTAGNIFYSNGTTGLIPIATSSINVGTASALAANAANCSAGSGAGGVSASGAAEDCTDYEQSLTAGDHLTRTGDDFDVDDDFILNTGDVGTGSYTFPTISNTNATSSGTLYVTGPFASTTKLFADGLVTCNTGNMLTWAAGIFGCEADDEGAGGSWPFTPSTNFATGTQATSTPLDLKMGLYASSTSQFDNSSTTLATIATAWLTNLFIGADTIAEYISDTAGAFFTGNTETGITVTYQDADNTVDVVCNTADTSTFGCLTDTDWDTFNNKIGWGQATSTSANQFVYTNNNGLFVSAASSSFFGYTPLNPTRQLTVAGTANQITSSAGAQDLSADRTWTLSLPSHVIFPSSFQATQSSTTHATSTNHDITGLFTFDGVTGDEWTDFCTTITGSAGLCDGSDATGAGGAGSVATSTVEALNQIAFFETAGATPALIGGDADFTWASSTNILSLGSGGAGSSTLAVGPDTSNQWLMGYFGDDKSFRIASSTFFGSTDPFTITKTGARVGIGTTTPGTKLVVDSGTVTGAAQALITATRSAGNIGLGIANLATNGGSILYFAEDTGLSSTPAYILAYGSTHATRASDVDVRATGDLVLQPSTGNVGITNTAPSYKLDVAGTIRIGSTGTLILATSTAPTVGAQGAVAFDTTSNTIIAASSTAGHFVVASATTTLYAFSVASTSPDFVSGGIIDLPSHFLPQVVTAIWCKVDSGTSQQIFISDGTNDGTTVTCTTTGTQYANLTNQSFTAGEAIRVEFVTKSGVPDYITVRVLGYRTSD